MSAGGELTQSGTPPRVYLLDVEGTTSPLSLVHEHLFPYARRHLEPFLREHAEETEIQTDLALLAEENRAETRSGNESGCPTFSAASSRLRREEAAEYLLWLMDRDRKSTALKSLQGKIWKSGYEAGELVGTVFPDVHEALARWSARAKVAVYSSGSVGAQQLIFRYSSAGDLTPFLSAYFDTRIGAKTSAESYRAIAAAMGVAAEEILFVSDSVRELDAAWEAGCLTRLSSREGNEIVRDYQGHSAIFSFAEVG